MIYIAILVDVLLVAILFFSIRWFTKNGLAATINDIGKTWLSAFCSLILGPWVGNQIKTLFLSNIISKGVFNSLSTLVENNANEYNLKQLFENLPEGFVRFLNNYNINIASLEAEYGSSTYASTEILEEISYRIATPCTNALASIIGYVTCLIVPLIFFKWLNKQIKNNRRSSFLMYLDKSLGFVTGLLVGYCVVVGISVLMHTAFQVILAFDANSRAIEIHDRSYVFRFLSQFDTVGAIKKVINMLIA